MEVTTPQYTFVSDEPAKAWEGFQQDKVRYRELLGEYHGRLKSAFAYCALAVPANSALFPGLYAIETNQDKLFTGSVGADLIILTTAACLSLLGVGGGLGNYLKARDAEKKLREQEQRMEVSARNLDDLIL